MMYNRNILSVYLLILILCISASVGGQELETLNYHGRTVDISYSGSSVVAVAAHDQRQYVVSEGYEPSYVGRVRGKYGIPRYLDTESGHPLSEDITIVVCNSLVQKGYKPIHVSTRYSDLPSKVKDDLFAQQGDRYILITVYNWETDTSTDTDLIYDLIISVYDEKGVRLGGERIAGEEELEGTFFDSEKTACKAIATEFESKMTRLLNHNEVVAAFK